MQKPNLIKVLLLVLTVCICLFGCSAKETGTIQANTSAKDNTISAVTGTDKEKSSSDGATVKAEKSSTENKNNKDTSSKSKTTTAAEQTSKKGTKTNKTTKHTAKQTTKRTAKSTTSSTVNCTVTVECKKVLDHMDSLKAGHEAFVPSGGIFFSRYPVTIKNGSTVYDAVKIACGDNGVTINATNSQYGTYVIGFNNIDEKDCGNESGWLYSVNKNTPGKSCGKYIVSNGDNIVFSYTC